MKTILRNKKEFLSAAAGLLFILMPIYTTFVMEVKQENILASLLKFLKSMI